MTPLNNSNFEPLVVLQFSPITPDLTKDWVVRRLTASHDEDDGADLLVRYDTDPESRNNILLIGATSLRLLIGAEELHIKKPYRNNTLREFILSDIDHYDNSENLDNILLKSEKQRIIWEEIQSVLPMKHEYIVPGVPTRSITSHNDRILGLLNELNFLVGIFPLHDKEYIRLMEQNWFMTKDSLYKSQDIHKIRNYFGENVAFYFAFLEFYTKALIPTSLLGIFINFWPSSDFSKYAIFCCFNVIWWTIFMERWKRLSNKLAYQWGCLDLQVFERSRAVYHGELQRSPITNQYERRYPPWKRTLKKYFVSYPIVMCSLLLSLWIYFAYYRIQKAVDDKNPLHDQSLFGIKTKFMRILPTTGYTILIVIMNVIYKKLATIMTDFENHRVQTAYENNLTSKLFIFYFLNCCIGLFYEAFFTVDYGNVAQLLIILVIINSIVSKFTEQIGPFILKRVKRHQLVRRGSHDIIVSDAVKQAKTLYSFEGTYADYMTIFEQYGYVALFSAIFPWVNICALFNNIFELRADAFKYCYVYQRPFAQPACNIGSWHYAFDILSSLAIISNTALIAMQPSVRKYFSTYTNEEYILLFVAAEHILLALKLVISFVIPDVPYEIHIEKAKSLFESNQALRREREHKTKNAQVSIKIL